MDFIKTTGTAELEGVLTSTLNNALSEKVPVLWLVPGGSNTAVAVRVMDNLEAENLENLTVILTDERFGPVGHKDSNFFQLHQAGFIERGATFVDLLYSGSFEETVTTSSDAMGHLFNNSKIIIGFFGMGSDGHTAGILPNSPATTAHEAWMVGYDGGQYQRFTLTFFALSHVQKAFVGAYGAEKIQALKNLENSDLPLPEQPAQIFKNLPEAHIYNDQVGDEIHEGK